MAVYLKLNAYDATSLAHRYVFNSRFCTNNHLIAANQCHSLTHNIHVIWWKWYTCITLLQVLYLMILSKFAFGVC